MSSYCRRYGPEIEPANVFPLRQLPPAALAHVNSNSFLNEIDGAIERVGQFLLHGGQVEETLTNSFSIATLALCVSMNVIVIGSPDTRVTRPPTRTP